MVIIIGVFYESQSIGYYLLVEDKPMDIDIHSKISPLEIPNQHKVKGHIVNYGMYSSFSVDEII